MKIIPPVRNDSQGAGHFGAPRGNRTHNGIDYECPPESAVLSPIMGAVTKLGYPYGDDLSWRYVEVSVDGERHRVFYVEPLVEVGDWVNRDTVIGKAQDLAQRYPGMTPHIHYEIKLSDDTYRNPDESVTEENAGLV